MRILWLTTELYPFIHVGGLGDVSHALPKALRKLGTDIRILIPYFSFSDYNDVLLEKIVTRGTLENDEFDLYLTNIPSTDVKVYVLSHPSFEGISVYGEKQGEHPNLSQRFTFLSKFSVYLDLFADWSPEVIHANDWPTGLVGYFLKQRRETQNWSVKSLITIHNMAHQGILDVDPILGHDSKSENSKLGIVKNKVNFLKMGILHSDLVTTVSTTYAQEILENKWKDGLTEYLQNHPSGVLGIVHGIDEDEWDPEVDDRIFANYSKDDLKNKMKCKLDLQQRANLNVDASTFVLGVTARLVEQKGIDLVIKIIPSLLKNNNIQMIVLGEGELELELLLTKMAREYPNSLRFFKTYSIDLSHQILAGADAFLIPSRFEPCGLTQLYSMKYGTIPIAHKVGGLADTVFERDNQTGFLFDSFTAEDFLDSINRAHEMFQNEIQNWTKLMIYIMNLDRSWNKPAKAWFNVYRDLILQK